MVSHRPKWDRWKNCKFCGEPFPAHRKVDLFCDPSHKSKWHYQQMRKAYWVQRLIDDPSRAQAIERVQNLIEGWNKALEQEQIPIELKAMPKMIECKLCGSERPESVEECPKCSKIILDF